MNEFDSRMRKVEQDNVASDTQAIEILRRLTNVENTIAKLMWGAWALAATFLMLAVSITVAILGHG